MAQDAKPKDQDDLKGKGEGDAGGDAKPEIDPKIADIMKDPDAVKALLEAKRGANAEAKKFREQLEAIKTDQAKRDDASLQEQGKFKELAEKATTKSAALQEAFIKRTKTIALMIEAMKEGIIDPDGIKLADDSGLVVGDDFAVEGASDAIKKLKEAKPYLFADPNQAAPEGDGAPRPAIRGRMINPDDDKISAEDRLLRYFSGKGVKPKK
jgi:hypothetical protein